MRAVIVAIAAIAVTAGCSSPSFVSGHLQCAASGRACPAGFYCAADDRCWRTGNAPDAGGNDDMSAPSDLAAAIAPSKCAASSARLCESFESPTALSAWTPMASNGFVERDTTRAYRGVASLHANVTGAAVGTNPRSVISEAKTFPIATTIYVRVWAYFPSPLPATFGESIEVETSTTGGITVGTDTGRITLNDYASPAYYKASSALMPLDRWTCLQFDMTQSGASGPMHVSVDGVPLDDIAATNVTTPPIAYFSVGIDFYANTVAIPQYDAWFDEIIVDDQPTACDE